MPSRFDTTAFQRTADNTGTFGTAGRNILRGPGQFNIDLSLVKREAGGGPEHLVGLGRHLGLRRLTLHHRPRRPVDGRRAALGDLHQHVDSTLPHCVAVGLWRRDDRVGCD